MSRIEIYRGIKENDGLGRPLRDLLGEVNSMTLELYDLRNSILDKTAFIISDPYCLYAHESQVVITTVENKALLLIAYASDKVTATEGQLTEHKVLNVYELTTKKFIQTFDLFYAGLTAGVTMPADIPATAIRMYVTGTTLVLYAGNNNTLYKRTIDISSADVASWTPSDISVEQMTMKDSNGDDVIADVTSANIQTHLNYVLGDAYAGYADLMPLFRNNDIPVKNGNTWYATLECNSERSHGLNSPTLCLKSTDAGLSWAFMGLIGYTTSSRIRQVETGIVWIGSTLHTFDRFNRHYTSTDGVTWQSAAALSITNASSRPSLINYTTYNDTQKVVVAITTTSEITGNNRRTTLTLYTTSDMISFVELAKIVTYSYAHYPSLCWFGNSLYVTYTKALTGATDRDAIAFTKII